MVIGFFWEKMVKNIELNLSETYDSFFLLYLRN
jgi:hypothetical protein